MSEVLTNLKPDPIECVCGCGAVGQPRRKAWNDGRGPHVKGCGVKPLPYCRHCGGSRQRPKSRRRENKLAKAIGGERHVLSGALSGIDVGSAWIEIEETANRALGRGLFSWWRSKGTQAKVARLLARRTGAVRLYVLKDPDSRLVLFVGLGEDLPALAGYLEEESA